MPVADHLPEDLRRAACGSSHLLRMARPSGRL